MGSGPAEIAALMSSILDVDELGADESFFEYGNSLLALKLLATVEQRYGATVSLLELVRAPTPVRLAELVAGRAP